MSTTTDRQVIAKITGVEMVSGVVDKRKKGVRVSGCVISFTTDTNVGKDTKLIVKVGERNHYFSCYNIEVTEDRKLAVDAHEVGYWARKFDNDKNFDPRLLMDLDLQLVEDQETLAKIHTESCWC